MVSNTSFLKDKDKLNHYLVCNKTDIDIELRYTRILTLLSKYLIISECEQISSNSGYSGNVIIQPGLFDEYDDIVNQYRASRKRFHNIHKFLNDVTNGYEETENAEDYIQFVKIHRTEKTGSYLECTLSRSKDVKTALKKYLSNSENKMIEGFIMSDIKFVSGTVGNKKIECELISNISWEIVKLEEKLTKITVNYLKRYWESLRQNYMMIYVM